MLRRSGNGRNASGNDSKVRRPMTTVCPRVSSRNRCMSEGSRHGNPPSRPITRLLEWATTIAITSGRHRDAGDRRVRVVVGELEVLGTEIVDVGDPPARLGEGQ